MKILRVTSDLYPYVIGGIGIHTHEMSSSQVKCGHDVTVFTLVIDKKKAAFQTNYNLVKIKKMFVLLGNSVAPSLFFKIYRVRNDFDIIHVHSHLFFSTNICALIRRIGSSPLVITNHGLMSASAPDWFNRLYLKTIGKWTLNSADKIICYTSQEKERLIHMLNIDEEKIIVIPNGVNSNHFFPDPNYFISDKPSILWVGRFVSGKGIIFLLQAIHLVKQDFPRLQVYLVGEGPLKELIEKQIIELDLTNTISIHPFISYEEMPKIYQKSDIFVLPSLHEGVPRTILEAMSSGVPVICTNLPHLVNIVEESGILVPVKDAQTLADAIIRIMSNPELAKKFGNRGRDRILSSFSWDDTVKKTLCVYDEIVIQR